MSKARQEAQGIYAIRIRVRGVDGDDVIEGWAVRIDDAEGAWVVEDNGSGEAWWPWEALEVLPHESGRAARCRERGHERRWRRVGGAR